MNKDTEAGSFERLIYIGYIAPIIFLGILLYVWQSTHPASVGPVGILGVFLLLYLFFTSLFFIIIHISLLFIHRLPLLNKFIYIKKRKKLKKYVAYYTASIIAFAPVLILAMQSVNQLSWRDVGLVIIFVCLAIFYVVRRTD
jgi:hypothetical protein